MVVVVVVVVVVVAAPNTSLPWRAPPCVGRGRRISVAPPGRERSQAEKYVCDAKTKPSDLGLVLRATNDSPLLIFPLS